MSECVLCAYQLLFFTQKFGPYDKVDCQLKKDHRKFV